MADARLTASMEDYVEAIFRVQQEKESVRPKDIASRLDVTRASVTGALQTLTREGLVAHKPYDAVTLTKRGETAARDVVRRHEALNEFFVKVLGVNDEEAGRAACAMEHGVPRKIVDRLVRFVRRAKRTGKEV